MAVFDASFLIYLFDTDANPPHDPGTGKLVTHFKERIEYFIKTLEQSGDKVVIPTPALSEYLVRAEEAGVERLHYLQNKAVFQIADFDSLAAVELATLNREAIKKGDKMGGVVEPWQKVKLDRQIVAIAKVAGESVIYSGDPKLHAFAKEAGLQPFSLHDLELPPEDAQQKLELEPDQDADPDDGG